MRTLRDFLRQTSPQKRLALQRGPWPQWNCPARKEKVMWFSSLMRNPKRSGSVERRRTHGSPGKRFTFRPQLEALEDRWMPSILTVTTPGDPVDSYGIPSPGSLRYEIAAAQNGDTINF